MNDLDVKKLLDSFYCGETSKEEELLLLNYFDNNDVPEELLEEKRIFLLLNTSEPVSVPFQLEGKIETLIDDLAQQDRHKGTSSKKRHLIQWIGIAASIAILIFAGIRFSNYTIQGDNDALMKAISESHELTEEEYIEVEAAVQLLAFNFNKGLEQLDEVNVNLEKTTEILNKTFNKKSK